jgi:hypothetical protein
MSAKQSFIPNGFFPGTKRGCVQETDKNFKAEIKNHGGVEKKVSFIDKKI